MHYNYLLIATFCRCCCSQTALHAKIAKLVNWNIKCNQKNASIKVQSCNNRVEKFRRAALKMRVKHGKNAEVARYSKRDGARERFSFQALRFVNKSGKIYLRPVFIANKTDCSQLFQK